MELRQLYYFVALADTLSFSRAAESLYVSQSALSKQISLLEDELGVRLVSRGGKRSITLTREGELLLREAKEILMRSEKLVPMLRHSADSAPERPSVFISVEPRVADDVRLHRLLTDVVCEQRKHYPGLRALFWREEHQHIREALSDGTRDLGILLSDSLELGEQMESLVLAEDEMVLVFRSSNHYPDTQESILRVLENRGVVLLEKEPRGLAQILTLLDCLNSTPRIRFAGDPTAMILTVESGESAMILPASVAQRLEGEELHILHFNHPAAKLYLLCAWHNAGENPLARRVAEELCRRSGE